MTCVITGIGATASVGRDAEEIFSALCAGKSGLAPLRGFDRSKYRAVSAYEIDDRSVDGVDEPMRATRSLRTAVAAAIEDAGLAEGIEDIPVVVGTTTRELRSVELSWRDKVPFDPANLHFGTMLRREFGTVSSHTVANACSASLYALALGVDLITLGQADTVIVAGVDVLSESSHGLLDRCYPEAPDRVRPFDRDRRGMLQGEGSAAVVLRRETGTTGPALARIRGVAVNCDAGHPTAPSSNVVARAIREAHKLAVVRPDDIDLVMLHGTGTPLNDEAEALAVGEVFDGVKTYPYMTAIKSMTGHTAGASGLHSVIVATQAMRAGRVPPIVGLDNPIDEVAAFRMVRGDAAETPVSVAQVDSFGFGGLNAVAILENASVTR